MKKLYISILLICISGACVFLTAFVNLESSGVQKLFPLIVSAVFWLSALIGYIFLILTYKSVRKDKAKRKLALISFFTNKYAFFSDIVLIIGLITIIALSVFKFSNSIVYTALISIIYLAFNLHCILNGRVFNKYIKK